MADRRISLGRRTTDSARLHWMKFYLDDWATSMTIRMMGPIARCWYWELLMLQWREGYIPDSDEYLMRYLRQIPSDPSSLINPQEDDGNDYHAILKQVKLCFRELNPGKLVNDKLHIIRTETLSEIRAKSEGAQRANAERHAKRSLTPLDSDSDSDSDTDKEKALPPNGGTIRARQMPQGFEPKESHRNMATNLGVELADEFVAFSDFHKSKGSRFIDWDKALNTWLRNARKFSRSNGNGKRESVVERVAKELDEKDRVRLPDV